MESTAGVTTVPPHSLRLQHADASKDRLLKIVDNRELMRRLVSQLTGPEKWFVREVTDLWARELNAVDASEAKIESDTNKFYPATVVFFSINRKSLSKMCRRLSRKGKTDAVIAIDIFLFLKKAAENP